MDKTYFDTRMKHREDKDYLADYLLAKDTEQAMLEKLEQKRGEGRGGWWEDDETDCRPNYIDEELWKMVDDHYARCKEDPHQIIDVINLLAMIRFRQGLYK